MVLYFSLSENVDLALPVEPTIQSEQTKLIPVRFADSTGFITTACLHT
jgi:hypothetical protein